MSVHRPKVIHKVLEGMRYCFLIVLLGLFTISLSAKDGHDKPAAYDPGKSVLEHIADHNEFHILPGVTIPLPVIVYSKDQGLDIFLSSKLHHGEHAYNRYVMNHGRVNRIDDSSFPMGSVDIGHIEHRATTVGEGDEAEEKEVAYITHNGQEYYLDKPSTLDGGLLGGGLTSFHDFSITKNVFSMLLAALILILVFRAVMKGYRRNKGKAPSGIQAFMEPFFTFMRDEVTIPMIGEKHYERFQPFILTLFFFILICNLLGLVPFFPGGSNIMGTLSVTLTLAVITFFVVNLNGNKHYWEHILWMPGIPAWVKIILTPVEILGLFIKPFSLMIRLFANITAGHIIILSLVGLIFLLGKNGESLGGAFAGGVVGLAFTAFMNLIELLVAFLQAFVFAILAAAYIGAAVEDGHHHDEHDDVHGEQPATVAA